LSEDHVALVRSLDGRLTVGQLVNGAGRTAATVEADIRHLAERGVLDLVAS
jgi:Fic family protein